MLLSIASNEGDGWISPYLRGVCVSAESTCLQPVQVFVCLRMHVSPPPHPAPLRDEQMDAVGGAGVEWRWVGGWLGRGGIGRSLAKHRVTKGGRTEPSCVLSPSFRGNTRRQAVPQTCQTNRWNKGVFRGSVWTMRAAAQVTKVTPCWRRDAGKVYRWHECDLQGAQRWHYDK